MTTLETLLTTLNQAPAPTQPLPSYFLTSNNLTLLQTFTSRITRSPAPLPHEFSLNFVSGTANALVFGSSAAFAQQAKKLVQNTSIGIVILDLTISNAIEFSKDWASLQFPNLWICVTGALPEARHTQVCVTLLRALACQIGAGIAVFEASQVNEVVGAIVTGEPWKAGKSFVLGAKKDQASQILQNARNAEEILEKMNAMYEGEIRVKGKAGQIIGSLDEYLKWADGIGKCGGDIAEIIRQVK